jgi:peptide/nickel transport system permease protein
MWIRKATRHFSTLLITALAGGLACATLVRLAPGFGVDERELDSRLSAETVQAMRDSRAGERNVIKFYGRYLAGLATGDLGESRSLQRPVTELFRERIPVTFRALGFGLLAGWALGLTAAAAAVLSRRPAIDAASSFLSGVFLCLPSAVLPLAFLFAGGGV